MEPIRISDWKSWTYTDGSCHTQEVKTVIGAGGYHPSSGNSNLAEPNGAGTTNTIGRAELAAIAAAIAHDHIHIATDSLTSLHQTIVPRETPSPCPKRRPQNSF